MVAAPQHSPERQWGGNNTGNFALQLVQEWLVASKLEATARCLLDECTRTNRAIPTRSEWNRMVASLGFGPRSPATGGKRSAGDSTLLEAAIKKIVEQREKDLAQAIRNQPLQQQVVLMCKKREPRFVSKRFLPKTASTSNNNEYDGSSGSSSSLSLAKLRPKSAFVCKSTSDLMSKTMDGDSLKVDGSPFTKSMLQRPISAASVLTPHRDSQVRKKSSFHGSECNPPTTRPPMLDNVRHGVMEAAATNAAIADRHSIPVERASVPHLPRVENTGRDSPTKFDGDDENEAEGGGPNHDGDEHAPTLLLEEMSEERLMEQFGSISRVAIKKLRRVLAKSNACTQEFEKSQRTLDKIKARAKLCQLRSVMSEEQTELLSNTMAPITNEPCSLCLYVFPKTNLTTKVSYKSIMDLRASWATANGKTTEDDDDSETIAMSHTRLTHLYDQAPVCVFCSQLVLNFSSYRPSSAERRAQEIQEKRASIKSFKARELERRNHERLDPLNYHSYELNSDDDDSDIEEIVEVKPDGRPHVVRRRRQRTMRVPVQLGVVSKRLHYDTLRSGSLQMLSLGEWQKITR